MKTENIEETNDSEQPYPLYIRVEFEDNGFGFIGDEKDIEYINLLKSRYKIFLDRMKIEKYEDEIGEFIGMSTMKFYTDD